jgi:hypothetical protein
VLVDTQIQIDISFFYFTLMFIFQRL